MKNTIAIWSVLLLTGMLCACQKTKTPTTIVCGRVSNHSGQQVSLKFHQFDLKKLKDNDLILKTELDSTGYFYISTDQIDLPNLNVWLDIGSEYNGMYITPGDSLYVSVDIETYDETLTFTGIGAEKNNYRASKFLKYEDRRNGKNWSEINLLPYEEFIAGHEQLKQGLHDLLDSAYGTNPKDFFYELEKQYIDLYFIKRLYDNQKFNDYQNLEEAQKIAQNTVIEFDTWNKDNYSRKVIKQYIELLAGNQASDFDRYQLATQKLDGHPLRYFLKYYVPQYLTRKDGDKIIADLNNQPFDEEIKEELSTYHEYLSEIKSRYPSKPGQFRKVGESYYTDSVIITGHVFNASQKNIKIIDEGIFSKYETKIELDSLGRFKSQLAAYYSHEILIIYNNSYKRVIIHPGSKIHLEINNNDIMTYGDGAPENERARKLRANLPHKKSMFENLRKDFRKTAPLDYKAIAYDKMKAQSSYINDFLSNEDPEWFRKWISCDTLQKFYEVTNFKSFRDNLNRDKKHELIPIPKEYYSYKENYLQTDLYTLSNGTIRRVLQRKLSGQYGYDFSKATKNDLIDFAFKKLPQKEFEFFFCLEMSGLINDDIKEASKTLNLHEEHLNSDGLKELLTQQVELKETEISQNVIPQNAELNLSNLSNGDSLLNHIINKHKGKTLYLDIWATWCGPCKGEFEFAKQFHEAIDHDKVALIYLAAHSKEEAWKTNIAKYGLSGDHYLLTDAQYKDISKKLNADFFPNYAIISGEGKLISKSAARPSIKQSRLNTSLVKRLNSM